MMTQTLPAISYPALLWREGYTYLATTPIELCAHPRTMFAETVRRAHLGEWRLVDANGRCFDVVDWVLVKPFGGIRGIGMRLLGSVFAAPVLDNLTQLSLSEFKRKLTTAMKSRYKYDTEKTLLAQILNRLHSADSYEAAIAALPKL